MRSLALALLLVGTAGTALAGSIDPNTIECAKRPVLKKGDFKSAFDKLFVLYYAAGFAAGQEKPIAVTDQSLKTIDERIAKACAADPNQTLGRAIEAALGRK